MHCGCEYTSFPMFVGLDNYSRYKHSVGCALIVWHFTQDRRQTIAALLHDIATPTFAHVVDFLNGDHLKQESTENGTVNIIASSPEIMTRLKEWNIELEEVADYHVYPIADNDSPKLSADRLEYTLSNLVNYRITPTEKINFVCQHSKPRKYTWQTKTGLPCRRCQNCCASTLPEACSVRMTCIGRKVKSSPYSNKMKRHDRIGKDSGHCAISTEGTTLEPRRCCRRDDTSTLT